MAAATACPTPDQLQRFALGLVDDETLESLSRHILECDRCGATLHGTAAFDKLTETLSNVPRIAGRIPNDIAVKQAIERACQLMAPAPGIANRDTSAPSQTKSYGRQSSNSQPNAADLVTDVLSPPQSAGEIGRLGSYRVLKLLDAGGMGMVFLAEDEQLKRQVALKVVKPTLAVTEETRQRFLREAQSAAALRHDNIVTIYQVGLDRGTPWLAMELLEGQSLSGRLASDKRLPVSEAIAIARQIAKALALAHARGLVHRDIKPANVWLEMPSGRAKVLDFGLARRESEADCLTQPGLVVGTPAYMAPEQARGAPTDHRADLFSLGCVIYHMLAGASPFRGRDTLAVLTALVEHSPPPLRSIGLQIPPALDDLIQNLLAKDPGSRPSSAIEVDEALATIEARLSAGYATTAAIAEQSSIPPVARSPESAAASQKNLLATRRTVLVIAAVSAVVLLTIVGAALLMRRPDSGPPAKVIAAADRLASPLPNEKATAAVPPEEEKSVEQAPGLLLAAQTVAPSASQTPGVETPAAADAEAAFAPRPTTPAVADSSSLPPATGALPKSPDFVSVVTNSPVKTVVGELGRENDRHIEVIDLKSDQAQIFAKSELRTINKDVAEQTVIDTVGLPNYVAWRVKQLLPVAASGKIAQVDGAIIFVTLGRAVGLAPGNELAVFRGGAEIKDPDTGKSLGTQRRKIARLEALEVQENLTKAKLLGDLETQLAVGDLVEPAVVNNLVAVLPLVDDLNQETTAGSRLAEELTTGLVRRGIPVVERRLLDKVLGELNRQQSNLFDPAHVQQAGKQLGAFAVVVGTVAPKDKSTEIQLRAVKVATGEILLATSHLIRDPSAHKSSPPAAPKSAGAWERSKEENAADIAYLSQMKHLSLRVWPGGFSRNGMALGKRIRVQGVDSPHGIFLHPDDKTFSEISYDLDGKWSVFRAGIAVAHTDMQQTNPASPLVFVVIGDEKVLWTSKPVRRFDEPQTCEVGVRRVQTLKLRVLCPGDNNCAHAVWLEPRVAKK
jgi:serine/threonine protein kinase/TolB-like protein